MSKNLKKKEFGNEIKVLAKNTRGTLSEFWGSHTKVVFLHIF